MTIYDELIALWLIAQVTVFDYFIEIFFNVVYIFFFGF